MVVVVVVVVSLADPSSFWPVFGLDWPVLGLNWLVWPLVASVAGVVEAGAPPAAFAGLGTFAATFGESFGASFGELLVWDWPPTPEAPPPPPCPAVGPVVLALRLVGRERRGSVNPCARSSTSVVVSLSSSGRMRFLRRSLTSNATSLMSKVIGQLKSHFEQKSVMITRLSSTDLHSCSKSLVKTLHKIYFI